MELSFTMCSGCAAVKFFTASQRVGIVSTYSYKLSTKLYFFLFSAMNLKRSSTCRIDRAISQISEFLASVTNVAFMRSPGAVAGGSSLCVFGDVEGALPGDSTSCGLPPCQRVEGPLDDEEMKNKRIKHC